MDATEVKIKVLKVLDDFGMSGAKAAEAMGVTYATFRNKKNDRPGHSFNEKNYLDLVDFIKKKSSALITPLVLDSSTSVYDDAYGKYYNCPSCKRHHIIVGGSNFCSNCGVSVKIE